MTDPTPTPGPRSKPLHDLLVALGNIEAISSARPAVVGLVQQATKAAYLLAASPVPAAPAREASQPPAQPAPGDAVARQIMGLRPYREFLPFPSEAERLEYLGGFTEAQIRAADLGGARPPHAPAPAAEQLLPRFPSMSAFAESVNHGSGPFAGDEDADTTAFAEAVTSKPDAVVQPAPTAEAPAAAKPDPGPGVYDIMRANAMAARALARAVAPNDVLYQHRKGGVYRVVTEGFIEKDKTPAVVYQSTTDGTVWVRSRDEFFDGRFTLVASAPAAPAAGTDDGEGQ